MIIAGVDVGTATVKTVILADVQILSSTIMPTGAVVWETAEKETKLALLKAGPLLALPLSKPLQTG